MLRLLLLAGAIAPSEALGLHPYRRLAEELDGAVAVYRLEEGSGRVSSSNPTNAGSKRGGDNR